MNELRKPLCLLVCLSVLGCGLPDEPVRPRGERIATDQDLTREIEVDGTHVYWVNAGRFGSFGSVVRARKDGSEQQQLWRGTEACGHPRELWLRGGRVHWRCVGNGVSRLLSTAPDGSDLRQELEAHAVQQVLRRGDDTWVRVSGAEDEILRLEGSTGSAKSVIRMPGSMSADFDVSGDRVFFTVRQQDTTYRLLEVASTGGEPTELARGLTRVTEVRAAAGFVYVLQIADDARRPATVGLPGSGRVVRLRPGGGGAQTIAEGLHEPQWLFTTDSHVFWVNHTGAALMGARHAEGEARHLLGGLLDARPAAQDAGELLLLSALDIVRVPLDGGTAVAAAGAAIPGGLAFDDGYVYWTEGDDVRRNPRTTALPLDR
ncbi:MAG: hypothetical protein ACK4N5_00430 [Myxococcales bacterium]